MRMLVGMEEEEALFGKKMEKPEVKNEPSGGEGVIMTGKITQ